MNRSVRITSIVEALDELLEPATFKDLGPNGLQVPGGETVHRVVIRHIEIDFRSGLVHTDDHVHVEVQLEAIGSSSATTRERIVSAADGRVAAESRTVVVHTDADRSTSEPWPDESRRALEARL